MRSHTHEHLFWCVAERGNFESLRQWKKRGFWHFLPPLSIFFEESVADFSEITSASPKSGKTQIYAGVDRLSRRWHAGLLRQGSTTLRNDGRALCRSS